MTGKFHGYIQVYTGDGKGKTTAALGLALRAVGRGFSVYIGQFLKARPSGERIAARRLAPLLRIETFGRPGFLLPGRKRDDEDIRRAHEGLFRCRRAMLSGKYRLVVFDEVNTALVLGLLCEGEILAVLDEKPDGVEVVLTGRGASRAVLRRADLVTEMRARKHYYDRGVRARRGIED